MFHLAKAVLPAFVAGSHLLDIPLEAFLAPHLPHLVHIMTPCRTVVLCELWTLSRLMVSLAARSVRLTLGATPRQ